MSRSGAIFAGFALLLIAPPLVAAADQRAPGDRSWEARIEETVAAIEMGDEDRARVLLDELADEQPDHHLPPYWRARLLERQGLWEEALGYYGDLLIDRRAELSVPWIHLLSGRWIRASRHRDEARVRSALSGTPMGKVANRCLVLPLEPLVIEAGPDLVREELEALGTAISAWVVAKLAQQDTGEVLSLHAAFLLGRRSVPEAPPAGLADREALPPVTSLPGAAHRLAALTPQGPPPWAPDDPPPEHYLAEALSAGRAGDIARALAHFQSEVGLAPTGILDPETRLALERAYREARAQRSAPVLAGRVTDPLSAAASQIGATAMMTGTLEPLPSGGVRWNVAWIEVDGGALLSDPVIGLLPPAHFRDAWNLMLDRIVAAAPLCGSDQPCVAPGPRAPTRDGALFFGRGMHLLEAGQVGDGVAFFKRSARSGGGALAEWLATAWGISEAKLDRIERDLVEVAILGPLETSWSSLRATGDLLAGRILAVDGGGSAVDGWLHGEAFRSMPTLGWLRVTGRLEGR